MSFDGIDDGIGVGNWFNLQSFTIAMWVKPGSWQVEMADIIDNNHDGSRSWRVQQMGLGYPPNNYHFGYNTPEILVFDLIPDIWQHLVITLDESNFVSSVYIDGNLVNTAQGEYPINYDGTESLQLGSWAAGARYWNGSLDEVRVFERALSAEEVQQLYQIESGADIPWLNFNPVAGMVQTNGSDPVAVTFDATGVQPGVYKLSLSIGSNDPVDPFVQVPVTMTVFTVPPVIITISGLSEGRVETSYTFTATIEPVSTTLPLSYTWQADGQLPITHTVGLTDTVSFDWEIPGTYAITVTASNLAGEVSDSHLITLTMPIYDTYLPLVIKSDGAPLGSTRTPLRQEGLALIGLVVVGIMERWKRRS